MCNFLAPQPLRPPPRADAQADIIGAQGLAPTAEEIRKPITIYIHVCSMSHPSHAIQG